MDRRKTPVDGGRERTVPQKKREKLRNRVKGKLQGEGTSWLTLPQMAEYTGSVRTAIPGDLFLKLYRGSSQREILLFPRVSELQDEDKNQIASGTNCNLTHTTNIFMLTKHSYISTLLYDKLET